MKTITEQQVNKMLANGSRINFYTGFTIRIDGVNYECAHRFSF